VTPRELQKGVGILRPKVSINPKAKPIDLDGMIVDELKLDEEQSFEEMVRQISREAQKEITHYMQDEKRDQWTETETDEYFNSSTSAEEGSSSDWFSEGDIGTSEEVHDLGN